jgi:energy-coupling factor transport system substrate-specific component
MMGVGLVGLGAGIIPHTKKLNLSKLFLVLYSIISSFCYGSLMTLWNWPYLAGTGTEVSYVAGDPLLANLTRFFQYELLTGGFFWDIGRAITTSVLVLLTGTALIATLNRAAVRAGVIRRG